MRLNRVDASLRKVKCHRPVVGNRIYDVLHARVDSRLCRPHMGADNGDVLRNLLIHRRHKLRILLVASVVGELPEALIVHRLPH